METATAKFEPVIQWVEECQNSEESERTLQAMASQFGYLGGRILEPSEGKPTWRVQGFMDAGEQTQGWLPDGLRYVLLPTNLPKRFSEI